MGKKMDSSALYSKTMGQKEQTVLSNHFFTYTSIFKPGMLIRHMDKNSIYDKILKITGTGLSVEILAKAMIKDAENVLLNKRKVKNWFTEGNKSILQI